MTAPPNVKRPPDGEIGRTLNKPWTAQFDDDERRDITAFASFRQVRARRGGLCVS